MEWSRRKYSEYRDYYMPWLENKYLSYYGENKTSYMAKGEKSNKGTHVS